MCVCVGGGGTLTFSSYVGLGPASTAKKYREFQAPRKIFEIFAMQKYSYPLHDPKKIEKTPKTSPIFS